MNVPKIKKIVALCLLPAILSACGMERFSLAPEEISAKKDIGPITVITVDETRERIFQAVVENDRIVGITKEGRKAEIALARIQSVFMEKTNSVLLAASVIDLGIGIILGIGSIAAPKPSGSCPLIFSFDGKAFVLEAEPYGGAIVKGLQRTEWIGLDRLIDVGGTYTLKVSPQLGETEYIDDMKLIVVDHAPGARAVPDAAGRLHLVSSPLPPSSAVAKGNRDVRAALVRSDQVSWAPAFPEPSSFLPPVHGSGGPAISAEELAEFVPAEALRDEIILEFPKPAGARTAKLVTEAGTTLWGAEVAKDFLALRGRDLPRWTAAVDAHGPEYAGIMNWFAAEELYVLKAEVETKTGWKTRGAIFGGGPLVVREKAYLLDIADTEGGTLRIRFQPPAGFWRFNSFAVDYSDEAPLAPVVLSPIEARNAAGENVRARLSAQDGKYLVLANPDENALVRYAAPPASQLGGRSVIVKTSGYYDPRISATGEPRQDLLRNIQTIPGAALRFAYARWLKQRMNPAAPAEASFR